VRAGGRGGAALRTFCYRLPRIATSAASFPLLELTSDLRRAGATGGGARGGGVWRAPLQQPAQNIRCAAIFGARWQACPVAGCPAAGPNTPLRRTHQRNPQPSDHDSADGQAELELPVGHLQGGGSGCGATWSGSRITRHAHSPLSGTLWRRRAGAGAAGTHGSPAAGAATGSLVGCPGSP
jgi:hypothetical protein